MASENPIYGPFFGVMGAASAIIFSGMHFDSCLAVTIEMAVLIYIDLDETGCLYWKVKALKQQCFISYFNESISLNINVNLVMLFSVS